MIQSSVKGLVIFLILIVLHSCQDKNEKEQMPKYGVFSFEHKLNLPGEPDEIYDAITGDISGWWDHSFSGNPAKFYIEAKPGGGFWEIFDEESGDGVLHATVIYAHRGKALRFDGPLGLSGTAIQMVTTYNLEPVGLDSTKLTVSVHGSGEMEENISEVVKNVWFHFLFERFKPYVEQKLNDNK